MCDMSRPCALDGGVREVRKKKKIQKTTLDAVASRPAGYQAIQAGWNAGKQAGQHANKRADKQVGGQIFSHTAAGSWQLAVGPAS